MLVGAANGIGEADVERYAAMVVNGFGVGQLGEVFVMLKARHWNGDAYSEAESDALSAAIARLLKPAVSTVSRSDQATLRFRNQAKTIVRCLEMAGYGWVRYWRKPLAINRVTYWWGAMAIAWEVVEAHEHERVWPRE